MYRYYCLSLYRNKYYKVRLRLKDIAKLTGEKKSALNRFNEDIKSIVEITKYYLPTNNPIFDKARRNCYELPHIEREYITLSCDFIKIKSSTKIKGYYIKLLLINKKHITLKEIKCLLGMDRDTITKYNAALQQLHLLQRRGNEIILTPDDILLNNEIAKQKIVWNALAGNPLPNITLNFK